MKKIIFLAAIFGVFAFSSCKKCYHCVKSGLLTSATDTSTVYQFDICTDGKEGNGNNMVYALESYKENGYDCTKK